MVNRFLVLVLVLAAAPIVMCLLTARVFADEPLVRENRPIANVNAVSLKSSGDLVITQGDREELIVEAEKSLLPKILPRSTRAIWCWP